VCEGPKSDLPELPALATRSLSGIGVKMKSLGLHGIAAHRDAADDHSTALPGHRKRNVTQHGLDLGSLGNRGKPSCLDFGPHWQLIRAPIEAGHCGG
jgi:hypothetical protein